MLSLAKFRRAEVKVHIFMYSAVNLEYSFMDMFFKVRQLLRGISFFGNEAVGRIIKPFCIHIDKLRGRVQLVRCRCLDSISQAAVIHCDGRVIPARGFVSRPAYFYYRACIAK